MEFNQKDINDFLQNPDLEQFREVMQKKKPMTEEELFLLLCDEVALMMETRMDYLLSLMYRLDVLEKDINVVLTPGFPEPVNVGLAHLILERQKQRIQTKKAYAQAPIEEEGWEW
jgi:hypothetical protein